MMSLIIKYVHDKFNNILCIAITNTVLVQIVQHIYYI